MKKRWTAALLALLLTAALLPGTAHAAQPDRSAGARLTGIDLTVYQTLRTEAAKIANGTRSTTTIRIPNQSALSWTLQELGIKEGSEDDMLKKVEAKFDDSVHMDTVFYALLADCPYELCWAGSRFTWGYSSVRQGNRISVENITVYMRAAPSYQGSGDNTVSASKISAAKKAADNAKAIVAKYQDCSDYEKLTAYRDEICRLAAYDMDAYQNNDMPYGDPWQLVYVFDGDPDTNVVCEGYAKAFKYLCDLSDFHMDVTCYTVSGKMSGGNHMWNVVRMGDGQNYLVDVTNSDSGMVGADGQLFLTGGTSSDGGRTCAVSKSQCRVVYTYSEDQQGLFTDGYLAVSEEDYVDRPPVTITVTPPTGTSEPPAITVEPPAVTEPPEDAGGSSALVFADVAEGAYYAEAVAWAVEQGITNGTTDTTFSPDKLCTEAEILTFQWRAAGKPDNSYGVSDEGSFYSAALFWAYDMGMLNPGLFSPDTPCTRLSAVSSIWWDFRFRDPAPDESLYGRFDDVAEDSPHAEAVAWAVSKGVTTGTSPTTFSPDEICTRGQIVTFLYRAYSQSA